METQAKSTQDLLASINAKIQSLTDTNQMLQVQLTALNMDLTEHTTLQENMVKKYLRNKVKPKQDPNNGRPRPL